MRLSTPSRTISENRGIVSFKDAVEQASGCRLVNFSLAGVLIENPVEREGLIFYTLSVRYDTLGELVYGVVFWGIENSLRSSVSTQLDKLQRHLLTSIGHPSL